ncbi:MAG TPA: phage holin family protein [Candidatus Acidoferrum sp.]|nr:phage holin family protein [Candidatus Acidoferrum sp.]
MADVLQDIAGNIQEIFRAEFRLAKVEIQQETAKAVRSGVPLGIGALLALYAVGFLLLAVVHGLSLLVAAWLASLIVGAAVLMVAMILVGIGRKRSKEVRVPEKTVGTMKENLQWAKDQIR